MTNTEFLYIICGLLVIIVLTTMASVHQTNVFGVIILVLFGCYFVWKNLANPLLKKILIGLVAYVVIITIVGFVWSYQPSDDDGLYTLIKQLDLSKNVGNNITTIPSKQLGIKPSSDKYTYTFSLYLKNFDSTFVNLNPYLFYRNESASSAGKNIGLKLGNTLGTFNTLYLEIGNTQDKSIGTININKWVTITVTVNKQYINVYADNTRLLANFKIDNLGSPSTTESVQFGNMPAYLANFSYSPSVIEPTQSIIKKLLLNTSDVVAV